MRKDLGQPAPGPGGPGDSTDAQPIVTVFELAQADPVTGGSLWVANFEGHPDTVVGSERIGTYKGDLYSYFQKTPRLYSDSNKNGFLDKNDKQFGAMIIPLEVSKQTDNSTPKDGIWKVTDHLYNWTVSFTNPSVNLTPIGSPADFIAYASGLSV